MAQQIDITSEKYVQSSSEGLVQPLSAFFAAKIPQATDVVITDIKLPPADSGFSSENFFVNLSWKENGTSQSARYAIKRQAEKAMFPGKSFSQDCRIQDVLSTRTELPVPKILAYEDDASVLGGRFYVMEYIPGNAPPTVSPHDSGMLADMSEQQRRKLWFSGIEQMGRLHRLDPFELGLDFVSNPAADGSQLTSTLDYWEQHYKNSCGGNPLSLMIEAMAWLRANAPVENQLSLLWGDSRHGNMLFDDDQNCIGIVDWELASLGDPLHDLAYWTYNHDHFVYASENGALTGWPTLDETIDAYQKASGIAVDGKVLQYYRIVVGYWIICTMSQAIAIKKEVGQLPAELEVTEEAFTPVSFFRREFDAAKANS